MDTGFFPGGKNGWGMTLTSVDQPMLWMNGALPLLPPWCLHVVDTDNFALTTRATYSTHLIPTDKIILLINEERHLSWSSSQYTFIHFPFSFIHLFPNTPSAPWTPIFSVPVAHLTHPNKETGKAELNLTKPMVPCTQQLNEYCYFRFCNTVLSTGFVSYQYSATHSSIFYPKNWELRDVGNHLPDYTVSQSRRLQQESSLKRRPQYLILYNGDDKWTHCIMHTLYKPDRL
jgi:hypothetical protein